MRAHVSTNICMIMGNQAKEFDDTKFNEDLAEVERLIDEIKIIQKDMAEDAMSKEERLPTKDESNGN